MINDFPYHEMKEDLWELVQRIGEQVPGGSVAATWIYNYNDSLLSECERLNVILPLIVYCTDKNDLPLWVWDELEYYHYEYIEGRLIQHLDPTEADTVIHDLEASFRKAFPNG